VKVRDVWRRLEQDGWVLQRTRGSHRIFTHPQKPGLVVLAGAPGKDLPPGTWQAIQKQVGWK